MLSRLMSTNPLGLVLLLLGVAVMLCGKLILQRAKLPAKLAALALAAAGAILRFV